MPSAIASSRINRLLARLGAVLLLCACAAHVARAEVLNVSLLLSGDSPPYQQFSAALREALGASRVEVNIVESQAGEQLQSGGAKADLVVAAGMKAAELAAASLDAPLLAVMIPKTSYDALLENSALRHPLQPVSAIYLDQPWGRQLDFIRALLPGHGVVGVLYSPDTPIHLPRLPHGMALNARTVRAQETLFDTLEDVLGSSDVLLAVPDNRIYSSNNVRNILLTSYRHKVPLIGFSQAYVNAGALGAIYSTPAQLAGQAAQMLAAFAGNRRLPAPQYPASFDLALNQQVARSLGIALDTPEAIRGRMDGDGGRR